MTPFTLEWWLEMQFKAINKQIRVLRRVGITDPLTLNRQLDRYGKLAQWIRNRIVNKYGER